MRKLKKEQAIQEYGVKYVQLVRKETYDMKLLLLVSLLIQMLTVNDARAEARDQKTYFVESQKAQYTTCMANPESIRTVLQATNPVVDYSVIAKSKDELKTITSNPNVKAKILRSEIVRKSSFDIQAYCKCKLDAINYSLNGISGSGDELMMAIAEVETQASGQCLDAQVK